MSIARYYNPKLRLQIVAGNEPEWLLAHPRRGYIRAAVLSVPGWFPRWKIQLLHAWSKILTERTGVEHVKDHIIPLNHPYVCGLTVGENLQVITRKQNGSKSNRWMPDQMELL